MGDAPQKPIKPPPAADVTKAEINALAYAEMQRRIRKTQGTAGTFLPSSATSTRPAGWKSALGQ